MRRSSGESLRLFMSHYAPEKTIRTMMRDTGLSETYIRTTSYRQKLPLRKSERMNQLKKIKTNEHMRAGRFFIHPEFGLIGEGTLRLSWAAKLMDEDGISSGAALMACKKQDIQTIARECKARRYSETLKVR